jgi:hypothetical protein
MNVTKGTVGEWGEQCENPQGRGRCCRPGAGERMLCSSGSKEVLSNLQNMSRLYLRHKASVLGKKLSPHAHNTNLVSMEDSKM